jgi:hypothetical protein
MWQGLLELFFVLIVSCFLHVLGWYLFCWICLCMNSASSIIFVFCFSLYLTRIAALYSSF